MTHEFEGAILRSLFVGATSPYVSQAPTRQLAISRLHMPMHD